MGNTPSLQMKVKVPTPVFNSKHVPNPYWCKMTDFITAKYSMTHASFTSKHYICMQIFLFCYSKNYFTGISNALATPKLIFHS